MMAEMSAVSVSPTSGVPVTTGAPVTGWFTVSRTSTSCPSVQLRLLNVKIIGTEGLRSGVSEQPVRLVQVQPESPRT